MIIYQLFKINLLARRSQTISNDEASSCRVLLLSQAMR